MHKAYMYPISNRLKSGIYNPYINNFIKFSGDHYNFLNKNNPSNYGIFNIIKYIRKIDIIFFNWIEKLPEMKGGFIQTGFLMILIAYCKISKVKIVWTLHNKIAHSNEHLALKKMIFKVMMKKSDVIITHASAGENLIKEFVKGSKHIFYFPHPVTSYLFNDTRKKEFDILIWGSLSPYKSIDLFLEYLYQHQLQHKYTIRIVGKCNDAQYLKKLTSYTNQNISVEDKFIDDGELQRLMECTRVVLFTYHSESVLSSGALAESLSRGALVIGPYKAAFKDLADLDYIFSFENFDLLIVLLDQVLSGEKVIPPDQYSNFLKEYHWSEFSEKLYQELFSLN